jgi:eukaryotic-like serine/threonine-protein kinase
MSDRLGQRLGNYRLIRLLGRGGFAEVYLGEHIYLKNQAAIKVLHVLVASEDMESFLTEARQLSSLVHPHIIRVLEFGVEGNTPFLVMDYAPNGSLRQYHPKGTPLPLATIVDYVKQVADALQYAHNEKVIHRDIKPENMLLGRRNEVLLSDFGIAIIARSTYSLSTQNLAGTIAYMAPEQIQAHPRPASDQYSLGVVVYEWLSGALPFHGTFSEAVAKHMFVPPPPLHEKIPTLPPEVEQVVLTALEKEPQKRFASVQAFARALELASQPSPTAKVTMSPSQSSQLTDAAATITPNQLSLPTEVVTPPSQSSQLTDAAATITPNQLSLPTEAVSPSSQSPQVPASAMSSPPHTLSPLSKKEFVPSSESQTSKWRVSRRTALGVLVGLAAAGTGITWWAFSHQQGNTIYTYHGHLNLVLDVVWSPHGERIASGSSDATAQVWDATTGNNVLTYRGHSNEVRVVPWSPDGRRIASGSDDHTVQVWDAASGNPFFTYRGHSNKVLDVAWSPDGKHIASGGHDHTVQVWDATTGNPLFTYRGHSAIVDSVAWSPDGKSIASASYDKTVQVWDAATGRLIYTYRGHSDVVEAVAWSPDGRYVASGSGDTTVQVWVTG